MSMRCYDIYRHCRPPEGSSMPFMILKALISDIFLQYISILEYR